MCNNCVSKSERLGRAGQRSLGAGSAFIAILIPKCPLCVAAWAWALSALGVEFDRWEAVRLPLTAVFVLLAALLLGFKAKPWVKALILFSSCLCLSFKVAEESTSFGLALAIGAASSTTVAMASVVFYRYRSASLRTN